MIHEFNIQIVKKENEDDLLNVTQDSIDTKACIDLTEIQQIRAAMNYRTMKFDGTIITFKGHGDDLWVQESYDYVKNIWEKACEFIVILNENKGVRNKNN